MENEQELLKELSNYDIGELTEMMLLLEDLADRIDTRLLSIKILERSQSLRSELVVYLGMMARGIQDILSYAHTGIQEYKKRQRETRKGIKSEEYVEQLSLAI